MDAQDMTSGGLYRTLFDMSAASYLHPVVMRDAQVPGMIGSTAGDILGNTSMDELTDAGMSFEPIDLNITVGVDGVGTTIDGIAYKNGYYVASSQNLIGQTTSSVVLISRSADALFLAFRGTDGDGSENSDWIDNF